ncbi:MAG: hypothetical protein ACLSB9_03865 [Hydrogeniiclostridium mannosilyticum]
MLKQYGVTAIELGAQSMQDGVLRRNGRGHTARSKAAERISAAGFSLGLQMMTGLRRGYTRGLPGNSGTAGGAGAGDNADLSGNCHGGYRTGPTLAVGAV